MKITYSIQVQACENTSPFSCSLFEGSYAQFLDQFVFSLYVSDLLTVPTHCHRLGYVDDTKIFLSLPANKISDAVISLNEHPLAFARWCCTNSLVINPDKTKLLVIGVREIMRSLPSFPVVKLLGKEIEPVPVPRYLGVIIDSSLSYNEHVTKTVSNCMHRLIRINRIKHLLDRKTLLLLINAFFPTVSLSNTAKIDVKKLQLVQNFSGRIVLGLRKYNHISKELKSLR